MADEEVLTLEIPLKDLAFKVKVPDGSRIVAALETPAGQLIHLEDLHQVGIPVKDIAHLGRSGPVKEEKLPLADEVEKEIVRNQRKAVRLDSSECGDLEILPVEEDAP